MESILTPIKLYLKDDNFKEIEELRISFSCKLQDYKFYKELFTPEDKMGVFYFEDYKVICNNTIIIKSPGFNKSINNINVDGNEELLSKVGVNNYFNLIMEYKSDRLL